MRQLFNDGNYWQRAIAGEFRQLTLRNGHPSAPSAPEPVCTRSMIVAYFDRANERVAVIHQYVRPDGTLGGSGRPGPKRLFVEGTIYLLRAGGERG